MKMENRLNKNAAHKSFGDATSFAEGLLVGRVASVRDNIFLVDYAGNSLGPVPARITRSVREQFAGNINPTGMEVLLAFENNDRARPIIIDTMYSILDEVAEATKAAPQTCAATDVTVDGKRITIEASDEIELKCGKASIVLTSAGKVIIKGAYVLSQSTGENRIRGGSVAIN